MTATRPARRAVPRRELGNPAIDLPVWAARVGLFDDVDWDDIDELDDLVAVIARRYGISTRHAALLMDQVTA